MLSAMSALPPILVFALSASLVLGQGSSPSASFEVASVRPSQRAVGPDYNNQIRYSPTGITARNVTLKRLIAEAYHLQLNQISGPDWLDRNEYEVEAKVAGASTREQMAPMLRGLLADRFQLREHGETRDMRVYQLTVGTSGLKIHPVNGIDSQTPGGGLHFHGDMREFADLLAIKLSMPPAGDPSVPVRASGPPVPVLDKTGLPGVFDFRLNVQPELGTDMFTLWQRALQEQLGLKLENGKTAVQTIVVDNAAKVPTEN
jgi:uncharacterized protein (TIGR03435 family)